MTDDKKSINPNTPIENFSSIEQIKKYLENPPDLPLKEEQLLQKIYKLVENDDHLLHFFETLEVFNDLKTKAKPNTPPSHAYLEYLGHTLSFYTQKAQKLVKEKSESELDFLERFFLNYNGNAFLNQLRESHTSFYSDSSRKEIASSLDKMNLLLQKFQKMDAHFQEIQSQRTYSDLLNDFLSGHATSLSPIQATQNQQNQSDKKSFLPDSEYQPPSAEPDNPAFIGENLTMNFNLEDQLKSIKQLFSTEDIEHDFLEAFPWAVNSEMIKKIKEAYYDPDNNLLGLNFKIDQEIQRSVIIYTLLTMDAIGKLADYQGDQSLNNLVLIKKITQKLRQITSKLTESQINDMQFRNDLKTYLNNIANDDKLYYQQSHDGKHSKTIHSNPKMNEFCHYNEYLAYTLTGDSFKNSLLAPAALPKGLTKLLSPVASSKFKSHIKKIKKIAFHKKSDE